MGTIISRKIIKAGEFYRHDKGRCVAVRGEVETDAWGKMLVIEETDKTGSGISCVSADTTLEGNWVEIGQEEWIREFNGAG